MRIDVTLMSEHGTTISENTYDCARKARQEIVGFVLDQLNSDGDDEIQGGRLVWTVAP